MFNLATALAAIVKHNWVLPEADNPHISHNWPGYKPPFNNSSRLFNKKSKTSIKQVLNITKIYISSFKKKEKNF